MIYFTSDTHYGHANIASKSTSKWDKGYRNFKDLDEMNEKLIININNTVKEDDVLYHMGDWSFGGIENIWKFRKRINCKTIHLILGNHDQHIENDKLILTDRGLQPAQELFTTVQYYKEVKINGKMFVLSHYAHKIWHGSHKGWYHLYGHSHDSLDRNKLGYGKSMDCGIDSAIRLTGFPRPFSVDEIVKILDKRPIEFPDHHDSKTNT